MFNTDDSLLRQKRDVSISETSYDDIKNINDT